MISKVLDLCSRRARNKVSCRNRVRRRTRKGCQPTRAVRAGTYNHTHRQEMFAACETAHQVGPSVRCAFNARRRARGRCLSRTKSGWRLGLSLAPLCQGGLGMRRRKQGLGRGWCAARAGSSAGRLPGVGQGRSPPGGREAGGDAWLGIAPKPKRPW